MFNQQLYNRIIYNISKEVKRTLNENLQKFDVTDYEDSDSLDTHSIDTGLGYKYFPTNKKELKNLIKQRVELNPQEPYLSDISTANITDMSELFVMAKKGKIEKLDLSAWDVSNVISMENMFKSCISLTELNLSGWDTSNVENMNGLFMSCKSLRKLDLSDFNTSKVTSMYRMFQECFKLTNLNLTNFNVSNVISMKQMFCECKALVNLNLTGWDTSKVEDMSHMFNRCNKLSNLDFLSDLDTSNVTDMYGMFEYCLLLKEFVTPITWDTSNVNNIGYMFYECIRLTKVDLSGLDTTNVNSISSMFNGCTRLKEVNLSNFNLSNVTSLSFMFNRCKSLVDVDLSGWNTSNIINMTYMFAGCESLVKLDLSHFNTYSVMDMSKMFKGCVRLKELDLSGWTSGSAKLKNMFDGCSSLKTLKLYTDDMFIRYRLEHRDMNESLYENIQKFNPIDFEDDEDDIVNSDTVEDITIPQPKNEDDEYDFFDKFVFGKADISERSYHIADNFMTALYNIFDLLRNESVSYDILRKNKGSIYLRGRFTIYSRFNKYAIPNANEHAGIDCSYINGRFIFDKDEGNQERLASMIEFCNLYGYVLDFRIDGYLDYFKKFQKWISKRGIEVEYSNSMGCIYVTGSNHSRNNNNIQETLDAVYFVCEQFVYFMRKYLNDNIQKNKIYDKTPIIGKLINRMLK